ncbi:hypothetical protein KRMM14A1259_51870 [Krasilnikovia sp. MM14-A1259]
MGEPYVLMNMLPWLSNAVAIGELSGDAEIGPGTGAPAVPVPPTNSTFHAGGAADACAGGLWTRLMSRVETTNAAAPVRASAARGRPRGMCDTPVTARQRRPGI